MIIYINDEKLIKNVLLGVYIYLLMLDFENGVWVLCVLFELGMVLLKYFYIGVVYLYMLVGSWYYIEYLDDL